MTHAPASSRGFTLIEVLIAALVMATVIGAVFAVFHPTHGTFQAQPEASDLQQRLRVGSEALTRDLMMAGAGTYAGPSTGTLMRFFAPIVPARPGSIGQMTGPAQSDALTVMYVPKTASQTVTTSPMASASDDVPIDAGPGCPIGDLLCGFAEGMAAVIFDEAGSHDVFAISASSSPAARLVHRDGAFSKAYGQGAYVAEVIRHSYYFDAAALQLRRSDGPQSDLPVLDNVVGLSFAYFGEPSPPELIRPLADVEGPWTTYGPRPPPIGVDDPDDGWGPGENCIFGATGAGHTPRLGPLGQPGSALVPLPLAMLADGPWCPDGSSAARYDADLLRIRKVRVALRVQTGVASLRGAASAAADALFRRGGTSRGGYRWVPDQEIRFDVTPRNLGLGR